MKRVEGKESPERKTDWEKERGGMSDFAAVFFLPSLLVPRGVPLWEKRSCHKMNNLRFCGTPGDSPQCGEMSRSDKGAGHVSSAAFPTITGG